MPDTAIDTRLHYRVGVPQLRALPLTTLEQQHIPEWWSLSSKIGRILQEEGVHTIHYDIVRRKREGETDALVPRTILVLSDVTVTGQYDKWIASAARLRRFLLGLGLDVGVEIIDVGAAAPNSEVITESDTATIQLWSHFQDEVLDAITGTSWLAVDVVWRTFGANGAARHATVSVSAADADEDIWWDTVIPQLAGAVSDHQLKFEVRHLRTLAPLADTPMTQVEQRPLATV